MTSLHQKLVRDLIRMRGQMFAVTLVLTCGIAMYVTMRSSFRSLEAAQRQYYNNFRFADVFAHVKRAPEHVAATIAAIPGVAAVQTRVVMDITLDIPGLNEPATGRLVSIPEERRPMLNDLFLREGRYIERGQRDEVLISEGFASANQLSVGSVIHAVMNGKSERLHIVGIAMSPEYIYEIRPSEVFPDNRRFGVLWMSRDVLGPTFNMKGAFNDAAMTFMRGIDERQVTSRVDQILDKYGNLGAYGRADQISYRFLTDELGELRIYGLILPAVFLGIVAFLLNVSLSRLISTQRREIGVLKAFGYTNFEIGLHYVQLTLAAVTAGATAGIGLGLWLASGMVNVYARYFHFPSLQLQVDTLLILTAAAMAVGSACLGAASAVHRAVRLAPAEAMQPEPPASFRAGLLERLGLRALLSPAWRIVIRNLNRRPLRASCAALGVALSVALIVSGRYAIDAVERLVMVQFHAIQREDVTVVFQESRPARVRHEVAALPGVLRAEPFREVPARVRFGHRSRRIGILGLVSDGQLRRPLDGDLQPVSLPSDGIVLGTKLAQILRVRPGNALTIEVLEGARPVRQITLAGVVDEPMGLGAYMDIGAVHRLMREGDTISGAYIQVDATMAPALYAMLKRTPSISGVAVRQAMLASFWKTFGESIRVTTAIEVGFACVIAFGIVYNGARIAWSERGNELACLRVLGYTRAEIGRILLGEQGLLIVSSIPVGFGIGLGLSVLLSTSFLGTCSGFRWW